MEVSRCLGRSILAVLYLARGASVEEAALKFLIPDEVIVECLRELESRGLVTVDGEEVELKGNWQDLVLIALSSGVDVETASSVLSWWNFEELVAYIFEENGFTTELHVVLGGRRGRVEIDVVARRDRLLFSVDCKHWSKKLSRSIIGKVVEKQIERTKRLLEELGNRTLEAYPIVVTLRHQETSFVSGVPVMPVSALNDFLLHFRGLENLVKLKL